MKTTHRSANTSVSRPTLRLSALFVLAAMTICALAGCRTDDPGSSAKVDPSGVYSLVSVDGKALPCEVMHGETPMTIKSGVFTINADHTCHSLMTFSAAGHEDVSREVKATYNLEGAELTMKWERAGTTVGRVDGNRFTMTNEGMVLAYEK
jgi:hypothetical protein